MGGQVTSVVNIRTDPFDVYIGRAGHGLDGYFGNPFRGSTAIQMFAAYFHRRVVEDQEFRTRVLALDGKRLGCFCKPDRCHGDVILAWLQEQATTS